VRGCRAHHPDLGRRDGAGRRRRARAGHAVADPGTPRPPVAVYVEIFRNTPLLIQIFIVYFGLPQLGLKLSPFLSGRTALVSYAAAYNAEIFRAGLIIVPQALRISFPALGNKFVFLLCFPLTRLAQRAETRLRRS
jgi:ABC-type amino acid transport system permease subunit